jgi:hypothetical protein
MPIPATQADFVAGGHCKQRRDDEAEQRDGYRSLRSDPIVEIAHRDRPETGENVDDDAEQQHLFERETKRLSGINTAECEDRD